MGEDVAVTGAQAMAKAFACDVALATVIAAKARYRSYPAHTTIIDGLAASTTVYVVVAGHARAIAVSVDGRVVVLHDFEVGDLFGEDSLGTVHPPTGEVAAVDAVEAGLFASDAFLGLMANYSAVAIAVSRVLVARLSTTARRLVEGSTLTATGRIHAELLRQARAGDALTIRPAPVLSVFALRVQTTRQSASRTINALQKSGIVVRDEEGLRVVAPHRLEELIY